MRNNNILNVDFHINNGLTEEEAIEKISEIQSNNSKLVKDRFVVSKDNLRERGYTEDEIDNICQTPVMLDFWINKGLTEEEAIDKVSNHQKYATQFVDYEKRLLPSNIEYWTERGFDENEAKEKVSESQRTFSKEICIEKYGDEEGLEIWKQRQKKWQKSLYENGNIKGGYSKVSQELFNIIVEKLGDSKYYYATNENGEFCIRDKRNYFYDFTDTKRMKIIEYNGDQYHANPKIYEADDYPHPYRKQTGYSSKDIWEQDRIKKEVALNMYFDVLYIWDSEYKKNRERVIQKCINFILNK